MKILYPNIVQPDGSGPTETASGFPYANAFTDRILEPWKGDAGAAASIDFLFQIGGANNCVCLFGLEADAVSIRLYSDAARTALIHQSDHDTNHSDDFGSYYENQIFENFTENAGVVWGKLVITTITNKFPKIGVLAAGKAVTFSNPDYGLSNSGEPSHIYQTTKGGSQYVRDKNSPRVFSPSITIPRTKTTQAFSLYRLYDRIKTSPCAWLLAEGITDESGESIDSEMSVWANLQEQPILTHAKFSHHTVSMKIKEFL